MLKIGVSPLRLTTLICLLGRKSCANEAALMSSFLAVFIFITMFVFSLTSGPGEFRRSPAELERHRDSHGGDPGCYVSGHSLCDPSHAW